MSLARFRASNAPTLKPLYVFSMAHINRHGITIHDAAEFEAMRRAGKLAAEVLDFITPCVKPGISTGALDTLCHDFIVKAGAIPAPLHYRGFPKSICTSVNEVICHGIPGEAHILKEGDILNIDITVILGGWHGDTSRMFPVGKISRKDELLIDATWEAMMRGICMVKPGATLGDIGHAIQNYAENTFPNEGKYAKYSIVTDFCGHGIGTVFHTAPNVLHYGKPGRGEVLEPGMFFTIEPMLNAGKPGAKIDTVDGWTARTKDRSNSAQFEHTLAVTETGYEIFTLSPKGWFKPPYKEMIG